MKRWLISLFLLLTSFLLMVAFTAQQTLHSVPLPPSEKRAEAVSLKKKDSFTILLLGTDEREEDRGRTDTIVLASVRQESIQLLSIPRDTHITIPDRSGQTKINHAYNYGGTPLTVKTVEEFLNVPIDYYVNVNMDGFVEFIDKLGGITVYNEFAFESDGRAFAKGNVSLNGDEALTYVRMRYDDPNGDFGRQKRQQTVMRALIDQAAQLEYFDNILSAVRNHIQTNLTTSNLLFLQQHYKEARSDIKVLSINGKGEKIDGTYYYLVNEEEQQRLSTSFQQHLGISSKTP